MTENWKSWTHFIPPAQSPNSGRLNKIYLIQSNTLKERQIGCGSISDRRAPSRAAGARDVGALRGEPRGTRRSCHHNRHGTEAQPSWSGCTWHGNCPILSGSISWRNRSRTSASSGSGAPSPSSPWSRCRIAALPSLISLCSANPSSKLRSPSEFGAESDDGGISQDCEECCQLWLCDGSKIMGRWL